MTNRKQLHERLWAAAEQLRANGELKTQRNFRTDFRSYFSQIFR